MRWVGLAGAAVLGGVLFSVLAGVGVRAGLSFVGGLAMVVGAFEFGAFNIRFTGRYLPNLTLTVALLSYVTTAIALGLILAASSPRVVYGPAIAAGLFSGLTIWIATELALQRVRASVPS
ncbi:hypothetical protein BH10ACT8_BH10ACT8_30840 [soil metagenome]